jgi:glycosyltransferase involved in cell wall biosynthesis
MASELTVIAFAYAAAGWHISTGENGITVPAASSSAFVQAAWDAVRDKRNLRGLGRRARLAAEGLDWDRVLDDFEQELREAIRQRATSRGHKASTVTTAK